MKNLLLIAILCCGVAPLFADNSWIPAAAPDDAVMASAEEIEFVHRWAIAAFSGKPLVDQNRIHLDVRRQDHSSLQLGKSCIGTPLKLGDSSFERGLGTHSNSEIVVSLPKPAKEFRSVVGVDTNKDTGGTRGSVRFALEVDGKELQKTEILRGNSPALEFNVALPEGTRQFTLKVDDAGDGPGYDQADWADAKVVYEDSTTAFLDETRISSIASEYPFSFVYNGKHSRELLPKWDFQHITSQYPPKDRNSHIFRWDDPETKLTVEAVVTLFKQYPAVEWVLRFTNNGEQDTPILENVLALDLQFQSGYQRLPVQLHSLVGDTCSETAWLPNVKTVEIGKPLTVAPQGGRSSNGAFPFWNLQWEETGILTAIGWSGQWSAKFDRLSGGPTRMSCGMEKLHTILHPDEKIRSLRVLILPWSGDKTAAHNRFRRLLMFHYVPQQNGRPLQLPIAGQCFDRYFALGTRPDWATIGEQLKFVEVLKKYGCDTHWFDAAWFEKAFPNGVGNWFPGKNFPDGLKPLGDKVHQEGMQFVLWFEPERVAVDTQIANEHPEYVFGGKQGGLYKLNDPEARQFLTELLFNLIEEYGVDVYRNDFNIDPLPFWRANDAENRQGITEIRYVEGHYAMWDEFIARKPGLWIDNCASGGRRIDLETISRSVTLWRSDTSCWAGNEDWDQVQAAGLALYIPLTTACSWNPSAYTVRSAATGGAILQFDFLGDLDADEAHKAVEEIKANRKFWYGDFYPLLDPQIGDNHCAAYQLHRADLDAGMVLLFRRAKSPYSVLELQLHGIDPDAKYKVTTIDEKRNATEKTVSGKDLAVPLDMRIPEKRSSVLIRYEKM